MFEKVVFLLFAVYVFGEAAFIDTLGKCSIKDNECIADLYETSMRSVAKTGIPEYGIPPFDPYEIKNIFVSVLNMVDIGMVDGVAKNIKTCVFDGVDVSFENLHASMDITCDVTVKGHYKVATTNPIIKNILGSTVQGEGVGKVKLDKLQMHYEIDFFLREANDEFYVDWNRQDLHFNYTVGKATFAANNIKIGAAEVSNQIIGMMNENSEFLITTFGQPFFDTTQVIIDGYMRKFFDNTPAKYFLVEDLRQFKKD